MTRRRRLRGRLGQTACPAVEVVCKKRDAYYTKCEVRTIGRRRELIGEMDLGTNVSGMPGLVKVGGVMIDPAYQRCGIGTRLYAAALRIACQRGERLASDHLRTSASEGFWAKQTRKGRASCIDQSGGKKISWDGEVEPNATWPCKRYAMHESTCQTSDLSGLRGARRRRRRR